VAATDRRAKRAADAGSTRDGPLTTNYERDEMDIQLLPMPIDDGRDFPDREMAYALARQIVEKCIERGDGYERVAAMLELCGFTVRPIG
jgi:hypothetical protein